MITLYGIEFNDDETTIMIVDGQPEVMVNRAGALRLCDNAPNQVVADAFRKWLADNPPKTSRDQ